MVSSIISPGRLLFLSVPLVGSCFSGDSIEPAYQLDGHLWHVEAEGATAWVGEDKFFILNNMGEFIGYGRCLCPAEHILFLSVEQGLEAGPIYESLVDQLQHTAIEKCQYVAYELMGADPGTANCMQAVFNFNDGAPVNDEQTCSLWSYECGPLSGAYPKGEDEVFDEDPDAGAETDTESNLTPLDELGLHVNCWPGTCSISEELYEFLWTYPEELTDEGVGLSQYSPTGTLYGFQFVAVPSNCLADHLGFAEGDVVTKVNGYALSSHRNWTKILDALASGATATLTFERNSTEYTLTVVVEE